MACAEGVEFGVRNKVVGESQRDGIGAGERRTGQRGVQTQRSRRARQQVSAADVGDEADTRPRAWRSCDVSVTTRVLACAPTPDTAAHHDAVHQRRHTSWGSGRSGRSAGTRRARTAAPRPRRRGRCDRSPPRRRRRTGRAPRRRRAPPRALARPAPMPARTARSSSTMPWFSELIALGRLSVTKPTPSSTRLKISSESSVTRVVSPR